MKEEKWKLVGGNVYRLSQVFDDMTDAISHAREMRVQNLVFLSKTKDGRWAVYWRSKLSKIVCESKYYSV